MAKQTEPRKVTSIPEGYTPEVRNGKTVYVKKTKSEKPKAIIPDNVKPNPTVTNINKPRLSIPPKPKPKVIPPADTFSEDVVYMEEPVNTNIPIYEDTRIDRKLQPSINPNVIHYKYPDPNAGYSKATDKYFDVNTQKPIDVLKSLSTGEYTPSYLEDTTKVNEGVNLGTEKQGNPRVTATPTITNVMEGVGKEKAGTKGVSTMGTVGFKKGGIVSKIQKLSTGGGVYDEFGELNTLDSGVVGQNDQYAKAQQDESNKAKNQATAKNIANTTGQALGGVGSAYYNSQPTQNEGEATRNAGLAATSQMGGIGGMIGGIAAIGDKIGKPIKNRSQQVDANGELLDEGKAKRNAAIGITFSPSKRLSYEGGLTDVTGQKYLDSIENKTKAQLKQVKDANQMSRQSQAVLARNNNDQNATITNPYNLSGVTFDENQNMILANGQQYDPNKGYKKGGIVGKMKMDAEMKKHHTQMCSEGGEIEGEGGPKEDKIEAKVKEGSFVVPAENAELAKGIRKLYLKAPNKKAKLKQEDGETVKLSNGEHLFTPEENEYLESIGIDLEALAPNAEEGNKKQDGGKVKPSKEEVDSNKKWVSDYSLSIMKSGMQDDMINDSKKGLNKYGIISKYEAHPASDDVKYSNNNVDKLRNGLKAYDEKVKGYAIGGEVTSEDTIDPKKEKERLAKEEADIKKSQDYAKSIENRVDVAKNIKKHRDFTQQVLIGAAKRKSELEAEYNRVKNGENADYKGKDAVRERLKTLLNEIDAQTQKAKETAKEYELSKNDSNYDASGNFKPTVESKVKTDAKTVTPKTEVNPSVVAENVAPTKPSLKAPKVTAKTEAGKFVPPSAEYNPSDEVNVIGDKLSPNERAIANADAEKATVQSAALNKSLPQTVATNGTPQNQRRGLADVIGSVDPTAFVGIGQTALGLNMLGKEKRPIDKAVIDPTYNNAVNRAQQDAKFGLTPEQKFAADQEIQGGLNDAKFAGLNASSVQSFNLNRAAINDAWKNKLGLKQADSEMRMNKQKYADSMAADRANILSANRRRAFNDAMYTFQQKQQAGSELIGAGLANTIGAYRFKKDQQARDEANKASNAWTSEI